MGLRGFGRLNFDFGWGKGPNQIPGIEPANFFKAPHETAARPMNYPAIAHWAGSCLTSHFGEGRGFNLRVSFGPFPHRNRDFGVTKGSGGIGLSGDSRTSGSGGTSGSRGTSSSEGGARLGTPSHGTRTLHTGFNMGSIWLYLGFHKGSQSLNNKASIKA